MEQNQDPDEDIHDGDDCDNLIEVEDFEIESRGAYARFSINDISREDADTVMKFLASVVYKRIVPKVIWDK